MQMNEKQFSMIQDTLRRAQAHSEFYQAKFWEIGLEAGDIRTPEDFAKLPFADKADLRNAYPLKLQAVPDEAVVRIHSSSGTTGMPVIIPYTRKDVDDWADMFMRCYRMAGITEKDRI